MKAFLEISTWAWIAGVFIVIKCIFKYLSWLYHDKDKTLRAAAQQAWDYLSQHSYFEVARAALETLYDRLAGIFQKRIRFFYLFLFFLLLNAASLCLGKYFFGIDPAELKALASSLNELVPSDDQLTTIDMMGWTMHPAMAVVSVFQLTLLDLYSFLFTMGIIWLACRSRSFILFLIELITDISILGLFLGLIFFLLYCWLLTNLSVGLCSSFLISLYVGVMLLGSYFAFRRAGHPFRSKELFQDPFLPLYYILLLPGVSFVIMLFICFLSPSLRTATRGPFIYLILILFTPIMLFWWIRIFKVHPEDEVCSVVRIVLIACFFASLALSIKFLIVYYPLFGKLYELLPSARNLRFVLILVFSSALPSLAHLLAMAVAIIAKATPKRLQQLINRHINAISGNDEKVLRQLGNAFGGLGALITAIIQLI